MLTLASQLLWISKTYPDLSGGLDPVIASLIKMQARQRPLKTASTKIKSVLGGTTIFGIKDTVARQIDRHLETLDLDPYTATLSFKAREVTLIIVARSKKRSSDPMTNSEVDFLARSIADDLKRMLAYKVEGTGFYSTFTDAAVISITQKVS